MGKVTDIDFDSKTRQLIIWADVVSDTPVTQSTYATLGYQGVTGIAYVELDDDGSKPIALAKNSELGARIPLRPDCCKKSKTWHGDSGANRANQRTSESITRSKESPILNQYHRTNWQDRCCHESLPSKLDPILADLPQTVNKAKDSFQAFKQFSDNAKTTSTNLNQLIMACKTKTAHSLLNQFGRTAEYHHDDRNPAGD